MAPSPMKTKAMKVGAKAMTKSGLADALAAETEMKKSDCMEVINSLAGVATEQVKSAGEFVLPGLCMIKTRAKPATKAGKREMFGKTVLVKARPAKTVVKAFPVSALKKSV
uniref:DNA-binding protein n=1 Tax=Strombidinopsis acuminata TaxID=141414 RepID=A0A7S3WR62_9SPIT|mmetsp:Transcript_52788/g.72305  ORF Transcript_52788/g.72305 Transcript_52788/m.72305 type:complete len:111 (+) Transcript_52788:60-392(+)